MKKYYNVYRIDKESLDLINVYGSEKREDIASYLNIRLDNFSKYTTKDIDKAPQKTKILNNVHYLIMIDND